MAMSLVRITRVKLLLTFAMDESKYLLMRGDTRANETNKKLTMNELLTENK